MPNGGIAMLLNFWDSDALIKNFMELYSLSETQICNILKRLHFGNEQDCVVIFCEETEIKLDEIDVAHDIEFLGKIVSTTVDSFESLKQLGLAPLDVLLEKNTPISQHLKKYQIEVKPNTHELFYMGKSFYIPAYDEDCNWCAYGDKQCRYSGQRYKSMYCPYLEAISSLAVKLYHNNSEIEMFLIASEETMLKYSTVKDYSEFFVTIEDFVKEWFGKDLNIGDEWSKVKQTSFIITVRVKYGDTSYRNHYINGNDGADANDIFWRYENFCHKTYDYTEQVPTCFWDNVWFINTYLELIRSFGETTGKICAGIRHDIIIPYDNLKIDLI